MHHQPHQQIPIPDLRVAGGCASRSCPVPQETNAAKEGLGQGSGISALGGWFGPKVGSRYLPFPDPRTTISLVR